MNSHIKRPRMSINQGICSLKRAYFQSHIREIAGKNAANNEVRLYMEKKLTCWGQRSCTSSEFQCWKGFLLDRNLYLSTQNQKQRIRFYEKNGNSISFFKISQMQTLQIKIYEFLVTLFICWYVFQKKKRLKDIVDFSIGPQPNCCSLTRVIYWIIFLKYSAHRLIGSRIIESAAFCNQILLAQIYLQYIKQSLNWIILLWPSILLAAQSNSI